VFAVILLLVVLVGLLATGIEFAGDAAGTAVGLVVRVIVGILTAPISALAAAVLYFDLRTAHAGAAGGDPIPEPELPSFQTGGFPPAAP
jgi:hypothetical protein